MQVRMQRGKSLAISVRPMGLVEVARLVVTGDTLLVVDKVHKRYIQENVSLITGGLPITVATVQDLLLGRAFVLGKGTMSPSLTSDVTLAKLNDSYQVKPKEQYRGFEYEFRFNQQHQITAAKVTPAQPVQGTSSYCVNYDKVKKTVAGNIATLIAIATHVGKSNLSLKLEYGGITWNDDVTIDASVPKGYKRVAGETLINMLGQ